MDYKLLLEETIGPEFKYKITQIQNNMALLLTFDINHVSKNIHVLRVLPYEWVWDNFARIVFQMQF